MLLRCARMESSSGSSTQMIRTHTLDPTPDAPWSCNLCSHSIIKKGLGGWNPSASAKGKLSDPKTIRTTREYLLCTVQLHKAESFVCDKVNERGDHFYFQCPLHTYNYDIMDHMDNMRSTSSIYSVILAVD